MSIAIRNSANAGSGTFGPTVFGWTALAGSILVVFGLRRDGGVAGTPTGFTLQASIPGAGPSTDSVAVYTKLAVGGETGASSIDAGEWWAVELTGGKLAGLLAVAATDATQWTHPGTLAPRPGGGFHVLSCLDAASDTTDSFVGPPGYAVLGSKAGAHPHYTVLSRNYDPETVLPPGARSDPLSFPGTQFVVANRDQIGPALLATAGINVVITTAFSSGNIGLWCENGDFFTADVSVGTRNFATAAGRCIPYSFPHDAARAGAGHTDYTAASDAAIVPTGTNTTGGYGGVALLVQAAGGAGFRGEPGGGVW